MEDLFHVGAGNSRSMTFDDVSEGLDIAGMQKYIDYLKMNVLDQVIKELKQVYNVEVAIKEGWQGQSRDKFLKQFEEQIGNTETELKKEFANLETRMNDLARSFYNQDANML